MAIEFSVPLENRPGALAELTAALAQHGVNIIAIHATACSDDSTDDGLAEFITNNNDATVSALRDAGLDYTTTEVLLVSLANQPGMLALLSQGLSAQGININAVYITMSGQVALNVSDINAAQKVILGLNLGVGHEHG